MAQLSQEIMGMNTQPLRIYICTHKDFQPIVSNPIYEVVDSRMLNGDMFKNGLHGSFYSELFHYYHIARRDNLPDFIGVCGYRKYFSFLDNVPDILRIFKNHDAIAPTPFAAFPRTIRQNHNLFANIEDLNITENIIRVHYPFLYDVFEKSLDTNISYFYNMFILRREDFFDIVNIVFDILDKYLSIVGLDIKGRIASNPKAYHIGETNMLTPPYQYRIGGFLAERITNAWLLYRFHNIKHYDVIKYNK